METRKPHGFKNKTSTLLEKLAKDFFQIANLDASEKRQIFSEIKKGILTNRNNLRNLIIKEIKFTQKDAEREVDRAYKTFAVAEKHADYTVKRELIRNGKKIMEKRVARGPLLAITPFSSPLSSPAHKIASGLLAGTSILLKPSRFAKLTGKTLFEIIRKVTRGRYVYFYANNDNKELQRIISDDRIGIISFTGSYKTGKKIIQRGGIKKYHMELTGGNSPVIFTPEFNKYTDLLAEKLLDGITAKNGQRCVSIKHIFIPTGKKAFISKLQDKMHSIKAEILKDFRKGKKEILGSLITIEYAKNTERKVHKILRLAKKSSPLIELRRKEEFLFPAMYEIYEMNENLIKSILEFDLPGPVVFIYLYKNIVEYKKILLALKNDYIRSGLQLSFYTDKASLIKETSQNILWGGIIVNDIPTFRDEFMSFGGFGKAGLGKEGFFETINAYTDPQVLVYNT